MEVVSNFLNSTDIEKGGINLKFRIAIALFVLAFVAAIVMLPGNNDANPPDINVAAWLLLTVLPVFTGVILLIIWAFEETKKDDRRPSMLFLFR